jgi:hypothetical protein
MGETRNVYKVLVEKPEGESYLKTKTQMEDNSNLKKEGGRV